MQSGKGKVSLKDNNEEESDKEDPSKGKAQIQKKYDKHLTAIEEEHGDQHDQHLTETEQAQSNNLLLKYDSQKQTFHFVEHSVKKAKEKLQKEQEQLKDVFYKNGQIFVQEVDDPEVTGKKRRREDKFETFQKITQIDSENKAEKQPEEKKT